jgi:hypothetical protein
MLLVLGKCWKNINVYRNRHCTTRKPHRHQCKSFNIGTGWTSLPIAKENLITNKHLLNMTSGLDDSTDDVTPDLHKADAGTRWAYHNM